MKVACGGTVDISIVVDDVTERRIICISVVIPPTNAPIDE